MYKKIMISILIFGCFGLADLNALDHTPEEYQACYRFFEAYNLEKTLEKTTNAMIAAQVRNLPPNMQPLRQVLIDFFNKYMTYDNLKPELANIYLRYFTVAEINQLTAFYQTAIGKKVAQVQPELTVECSQVGEKIVKEHIAELQQAIAQKLQSMKKTK